MSTDSTPDWLVRFSSGTCTLSVQTITTRMSTLWAWDVEDGLNPGSDNITPAWRAIGFANLYVSASDQTLAQG